MELRALATLIGGLALSSPLLPLPARAQQRPEPPASARPADDNAIAAAVDREVKGLSAEQYPERQAAAKRLERLLADQIHQRAEVQEIVDLLLKDLQQQQRAMAMVTDQEAQAKIGGLLELERGLAGWTAQAMAEPLDRRKTLLDWGLGPEGAPAVALAYAQNRARRLEGIKTLGKLDAPGAGWTLSRLINDNDAAIRAAAMAAAWTRDPKAQGADDIVAALWHRAVSGPLDLAEQERVRPRMHDEEAPRRIKVDFPEGDPMEFEITDDPTSYEDAILAGDVLVHLHSPLVGERIKALVVDRQKAGKNLILREDPDWTLVAHRLAEAYDVKEAVPMLALEALNRETDEMAGEVNGRPYTWSPRTLAVGVLCKLLGQEPANFALIRVRETADLRGWTWGTDVPLPGMGGGMPGQQDGAVVRAFYKWWKEHHAEYGVKEEPSAAGVPQERRPRGRGAPQILPAPIAPAPAE
jgi:hypothetical protein